MLRQSKASSYALARAVAELHEADPVGFQELLREGLALRRRLYYLRQVGWALKSSNVPDEMLGRVGWTKLAVIAECLTSENAEELVKLALTSTVVELRQALGIKRGPKTRQLALRLPEVDYNRIVAALTDHGATLQKSGIKNAGPALIAMIEALPKTR
jgi:hypothetical protein